MFYPCRSQYFPHTCPESKDREQKKQHVFTPSSFGESIHANTHCSFPAEFPLLSPASPNLLVSLLPGSTSQNPQGTCHFSRSHNRLLSSPHLALDPSTQLSNSIAPSESFSSPRDDDPFLCKRYKRYKLSLHHCTLLLAQPPSSRPRHTSIHQATPYKRHTFPIKPLSTPRDGDLILQTRQTRQTPSGRHTPVMAYHLVPPSLLSLNTPLPLLNLFLMQRYTFPLRCHPCSRDGKARYSEFRGGRCAGIGLGR